MEWLFRPTATQLRRGNYRRLQIAFEVPRQLSRIEKIERTETKDDECKDRENCAGRDESKVEITQERAACVGSKQQHSKRTLECNQANINIPDPLVYDECANCVRHLCICRASDGAYCCEIQAKKHTSDLRYRGEQRRVSVSSKNAGLAPGFRNPDSPTLEVPLDEAQGEDC